MLGLWLGYAGTISFSMCRNYAIADYLQSQGYGQTLDSFRKELDTVS